MAPLGSIPRPPSWGAKPKREGPPLPEAPLPRGIIVAARIPVSECGGGRDPNSQTQTHGLCNASRPMEDQAVVTGGKDACLAQVFGPVWGPWMEFWAPGAGLTQP